MNLRRFVSMTIVLAVVGVTPSRGELCSEIAFKLGMPRDDNNRFSYQEVVQADGMSAAELFSRARAAIATIYRSGKHVTELEDKEAGRLIAKGTYVAMSGGLMATPEDIRHTLTIEVKDGRYRITVNELVFAPIPSGPAAAMIHDWPMEEYAGPHTCIGKKTIIENVHKGAKNLIAAVKSEMAKGSPAGNSNW